MISIKETKIKFTTILIMALFLGSMFYFNPENTLNELVEELQINEQITDSKFIDDSVNESPTTSSVIDYNTWYLGETVDTTISFAKANYQFDTITISLDSETGQDSYSGFRNYASYTSFQAFNKDNDDETKVYVFFAIDVARVGTTFYKISSSARKVTGWLSGSTHESSFALSSAYIQSDGKAFFQITSQQYYISASQWVHFTLSIAVMNIDGTWVTLASGLTSNTAGGTFTSHHLDGALDIYYFYNQADEITENARMQIKYTSPTTKLGKVDFYNPVFETTVALNLSEIWGYSSITPTATTSFVSNDLTITNTIPSTYSVLFTSNCSNHLAIEDVSDQFLSDVGFEGSTDIYTNWVSNPFETFETSTEQSFAGYSSLKTVQNSGTYGISYVLLSNDYYYVSCWAYIDSITGGAETVSIAWWNGTAWNHEYFDDTIIDRWQNLQFYMQIIDDDSGRNFQFYVSATTATVYFDYESLLFQTSTTIKTTQSSKYESSSTLISWDGYKNPVIPFVDVELELWDRTALGDTSTYADFNDLIFSTTVTTDENGIAIYNYESGLEQKEYALYVYSTENTFGEMMYELYGDSIDFDEGDIEGLTGLPTMTVEGTVFSGIVASGSTYDILAKTGISFDTEDYYHLIYSLKAGDNIDSTNNHCFKTILGTPTQLTASLAYPDDFTNYHYDMRQSTSWTGTASQPELVNIEDTVFEGNEEVLLDYWLFTSEAFLSALYFTPSIPTETDYATDELNDAWDFSEGDMLEMTSTYLYTKQELNGYIECSTQATRGYARLTILDISFDSSYYDYVAVRVWVNDTTDTPYLRIRKGAPTLEYSSNLYPTLNEWAILTDELNWNGEIGTNIQIHFGSDAGTFTTNALWRIDYVLYTHVDSWLEETNDYATDVLLDAWDFEEYDVYNDGNNLDGWMASVGSQTFALEDGSFKIGITGTDAYTRIKTSSTLSIDASTYTRIEIIIKTNEDNLQIMFAESGNQAITAKTEIGVANVFHKLIFDIDDTDWSGTETALYLWLYDSSGNFEADEFFWIEEIRLIHLEEMPYTTIQNSVLLESETNDLQYNLYLDHNLIGTFSDLSLIPIPQTAGTHYLSVQPFRTDEAYSTQQIFSYYYTVEAAAFSVSVENFYLSDDYANLFVTSNYNCSYEITSGGTGSGNIAKEGTTISVTRITTPGSEVTLTIDFTYGSETVTFSTRYNNPVSAFYVSSYTIDIQEENIEIIWSTSKSTIDSLTVYEDGSLTTVDADTTSPSAWAKSSTIGVHYVTLIFSAAGFQDIIYSFNYEIVSAIFEINIESFHLSELYVNTYITASENGNYQVYENNTAIPSDSPTPFFSIGTSIQTDRDTTEGAFINYAIKFWNAAEDTIWFNTTYSNTEGVFFVTSYSVNIGDTTITVTWATSLPDSDKLTVYEDGALTTVNEDTTSPSAWSKSTVVGTHSVTLLFEADGYTTVAYSFNYHIYAVADFQVDIGSFQVSDNFVNTYASANYDGSYYVYEDNEQIETGTLYGSGTVIETNKNITAGITIAYAVKFVYESTEIWFNTTYSNPRTPFYLTDYRVTDGSNITITWNTTLPALDSLTIYEDGVLVEDSDSESTTTWLKSTVVGNHYVTLIFSAAGYDDIIHSFSYIVLPPTAFSIDIESFYVSDDYLNIYATANFDYTYIVYQNDLDIGSGSGMAVGTIIISPKSREAGLYNFTIVFTYGSENITFMTWYSNLIPPLHPSNDLYRTDSQGFYNISLYTNLAFFWVDVWHDSVLIIDDSTETRYSIPKASKVGLHNITLIYSYNISTDSEGYPIAEYNATISYEFWYETKLFYDIRIRYVPTNYLGLAIGDAFEVSWVNTYFNGKLIFDGEIDDVPDYSNYTFIANDYIRIRNNMPIHNLTITDLFGREIMYNLTIDISSFAYAIIELPVYRLGVVNNDDESHKISIRSYLSGEEWQTTPILPPGYQTEYWICNRTYEIRILSVGSTTYDENGAMVELYDDITDYPELRTVPYVIVIPLDLVFEPEEEEEVIDKWWTKPAFIAGMSAIALIIILVAIYIVNKNVKKKERLNK